MEFHLLLTFSLLSVLLAATTDASFPAEDYWKSVLPNTPFPKALEGLLNQNAKESNEHYIISLDNKDGKNTFLNVGKDETKDGFSKEHYIISLDHKDTQNTLINNGKVDAKDGFPKEHYILSLAHNKESQNTFTNNVKDDAKDGFSKEHYILSLDNKDSQNTFINNVKDDAKDGFSKEHYILSLDHKDGQNTFMDDKKDNAKDGFSKERYIISLDHKDAAKDGFSKEHYIISLDTKESKNTLSSDDKVNNNWMDAAKGDFSYVAAFYSPGDLYPGRRMKLHFRNVGSRVGFLPRKIAKSIPFSSDQIPEILNHFSIKVGSEEAKSIADVLDLCEGPKMEGEEKSCPTSFESMIDFAVTRLGQSTVLSSQPGKKQEYTVLREPKKIGDKTVVCHKNVYPYAQHYCHQMKGTKAYTVPLHGADGTRAKVVTICHEDTSAWNPNELAFQILKAKPGMTICHFLANDTLVWVPAKAPGRKFLAPLLMPFMDQ